MPLEAVSRRVPESTTEFTWMYVVYMGSNLWISWGKKNKLFLLFLLLLLHLIMHPTNYKVRAPLEKPTINKSIFKSFAKVSDQLTSLDSAGNRFQRGRATGLASMSNIFWMKLPKSSTYLPKKTQIPSTAVQPDQLCFQRIEFETSTGSQIKNNQ